MAGSARLSSRGASSIAAPQSSTTTQPREGFLYEDMAGMSTFPTGETLLRQPGRAIDHRSFQPLPLPLRQHQNQHQQHHHHQQQQHQRELAMKRRISEEMERERERERILLLERGRSDRFLMERASRIAGSTGRMYNGDASFSQLPADRSALMFPDKRLDGASILGSGVAYNVPERRPEIRLGSSFGLDKAESLQDLENLYAYDRRNEIDSATALRAENIMDRGFLPLEALKGKEEPHSFDDPRPFSNSRVTKKHGVNEFPRIIENARMQDSARGPAVPRGIEKFRVPHLGMGSRNKEQVRTVDSRAMDTLEANFRNAEQPRDRNLGLENTIVSRDKMRSSESSRVVDKLRGLENNIHVNSPVVTGTMAGLNRQHDILTPSERGFETITGTASNRIMYKSTTRKANHERRRSVDSEEENCEQEDVESQNDGERQRERSTDEVSIHELVAQYKMALAELTFNSKPIITNLTIIAGENLHASNAIAATVCSHILEVPVEQKLPSLYLLDSIVKNISSSYVKHFAARLPEVFVKSYREVDPSQYPAMQHLFKTWRGVFDSEPLREIERELQLNILRSDPSSSAPSSNAARSSEPSPLQQRSSHGIHVNPKYLEAQRQKLQQCNQLQSQSKRGGSLPEEASTMHKLSASLPEFDYATLGDKGGDNGERKNFFDMGLPIREENNLENTSFRYRMRDAYDVQHSPRALIDAYGNVRGMRSSRLPSPPIQSAQELDKGASRDWQNAEEEEFSWADVNPKVLDVNKKSRRDKDGWPHDGAAKNLLSGSLSAEAQRASFRAGWGELGMLAEVVDRPASVDNDIEGLPPRRSSRFLGYDSLEDSHTLGLKADSFGEQPLLSNRLPHPATEPPSPPQAPQARPSPLQGNRTLTHTAFGKPPNVTDFGLTEGASANPPVVSHSSLSSISGPIFGDANLKLEAFSPVTSGINLNLQRQVSKASHVDGSHGHHVLSFPNPTPPSRPSSGPLHQQNFTKSAQFQGQVFDNSSEQPTPMPPRLPPVVQQLPLNVSGVARPPLFSQNVTERLSDQGQSHSGSAQTTPVWPQIPSHLLESLQELHRHLPVLSEGHEKVNLPVPAPHGQDSSQAATTKESGGMFPQGKQLPSVPARGGSMSIEDTLTRVRATKNGTNIFSALLPSTLKPPTGGLARVRPESLASSIAPPSDSLSLVSAPFPGVPPLPFGPPPTSMGLTNLTAQSAPFVSSFTSSSVAFVPLPGPPTITPARLTQPPLPPGPPPSSQQAKLMLQPQPSSRAPPTSGADLNSLLSSLMAHGVLSGPLSTTIPAQSAGVISNPSNGILGPNPSSHLPLVGVEHYGKVPYTSSAGLSTASVIESKTLKTPSDAVNKASNFDGMEFKQELLRERRESVIKGLYSDFPRQCKTCGLRFKHQEEHSEHMDWHVTRNRRQKSSKKVSRKWFVNTKEWLSGTGAASSEVSPAFFPEVAEKVEEPETLVAVPADENQVTCALCGEPFEDFYSDEIDEWMYKGAVYLNAPPGSSVEGLDKTSLGPIVHANCRSESAATTATDLEDDLNDSYPQS